MLVTIVQACGVVCGSGGGGVGGGSDGWADSSYIMLPHIQILVNTTDL